MLLFMYLQRKREQTYSITWVKCTSCLYYNIALAVLSWPSVHQQAVCYHTLRARTSNGCACCFTLKIASILKISASCVGSRYQSQEWAWHGMTWWNSSHVEPTVNGILCVLCLHFPDALHVVWFSANVW